METKKTKNTFPFFPLADLHVHTRPSIAPNIYWRLAHEQGIKLPKKDYQEFENYLRLSEKHKMPLNEYFEKIYHSLLYKLSSGTIIQEKVFYEIFSGAYRNNISLLELRTDIMKVNHNGEQDLDHIIMASLRGMERALLEYENMSAGIIFSLAREFSYEKNEIMVEKAIKYHKRGVIGIDFAGPSNKNFSFKDYKSLAQKAYANGLKITAHAGEIKEANDVWEALEFINPLRIGHGIRAAYDKNLMKELAKRKTVLEICPMSNIVTNAVNNLEEMKFILRTFIENKVLFTINTDWPEMIEDGHLWRVYKMLRDEKIMTSEELYRVSQIGFASSFIKKPGIGAYL